MHPVGKAQAEWADGILHLPGMEIARQIGASKSGLNEFLKAFGECASISYPLPAGITNYGIAEMVYQQQKTVKNKDKGAG